MIMYIEIGLMKKAIIYFLLIINLFIIYILLYIFSHIIIKEEQAII